MPITAPFPGFHMTKRTPEPHISQKVSLPATLVARFSRFHWDPVLNKPQYGAISKVVTELLSDYVNRMEGKDDQRNGRVLPSE
jgi:hypothetical protein